MALKKSDLYLCRLCLRETDLCFSIFHEEIVDIIETLTSVRIERDDQFSETCCVECLKAVHEANNLRTKIIETDNYLKFGKTKDNDEPKPDTVIKKEQEIRDDMSDSKSDIEDNLPISLSVDDDEENEIVYISCDPAGKILISETKNVALEEVSGETITINPDINRDLKEKLKEKRAKGAQAVTKSRRGNFRNNPERLSIQSIQGFFKCDRCQQHFDDRKLYLLHMRKHEIPNKCDICDADLTPSQFRRHMDAHYTGTQVCELCGAIAKNMESLRGHMFYMHKCAADQYKCEPCNKIFRFKYKYNLHMRRQHGGARSHVCEVCGKWFYTFRDMQRHLKSTHLKLRPYTCSFCEKGFSSSYARKTHIRKHTNEFPFKCHICAEGFRQKVSLKTHLRSKHAIILPSGVSVDTLHLDAENKTDEGEDEPEFKIETYCEDVD